MSEVQIRSSEIPVAYLRVAPHDRASELLSSLWWFLSPTALHQALARDCKDRGD
jgi:hypothetical protein